jgi:hypothetical protein
MKLLKNFFKQKTSINDISSKKISIKEIYRWIVQKINHKMNKIKKSIIYLKECKALGMEN